MTLDREIATSASVLGLLLVFVFGYFAAVLPIVLSLLELPRPDVADDRSALISRLASYRQIVGGLLLLTLLVILILLPLSRRVVLSLGFAGRFATVRAALLVMDAMLLTLLAATGRLWWRIGGRIRVIQH